VLAGFDTSLLDLPLLSLFKANGLSISDAMLSGSFPKPGKLRLVLGKLSTGLIPAIEAVIPGLDLGFLPPIPGIPVLDTILPEGVVVYFDPAVPLTLPGLDLTFPIPDFDLVPGIFGISEASG
jgi:hypothetical protein